MAKLESKAAAKKRLQAEGRWQEAVAFREGLKKQGVSPAEAHRQMVEKFQPINGVETVYSPPIRAEEGGSPPVPINGSRPRRWRNKKHRVDWRRDVEWVYQNLDRLEPRGAPSAGALAMHGWARGHQAEFFAQFVVKALPKAEKEPERTLDGGEAMKYLQDHVNAAGYGDPPNDWRKNYQDARACPLQHDCPALKAARDQARRAAEQGRTVPSAPSPDLPPS
jgi:hypothetical protein